MATKPRKSPEDSKYSRNPIKNKAPVVDARRGSTINHDAPTAKITEKAKGPRDRELILNALNRHFVFTSLTNEDKQTLIQEMKLYIVGARQSIFEQNQPGNNFFVIAAGKLEVIVNENPVKILQKGESFGELALLHDAPRSATIHTIDKVAMWALDRQTFRTAVESVNAENYQETKTFIESVPVFECLNGLQKESLIGALYTLQFRPNDYIVNEGDPGDLFYLITEGEVVCLKSGKEIRRMFPSEYFGEQALLYNSPRTASIVAVSHVKCLAIGRERLTRVLGSELEMIIYNNSIKIALENSVISSYIRREQMSTLVQVMKIKIFKNGEKVVPAGTPKGRFMWVVVKGKLMENGIKLGEVFSCLGEHELLKEPEGEYLDDILASGSSVDIAEISKEDLETAIGGNFHHASQTNEALVALRKVQVFRALSMEKIQQLIGVLETIEIDNERVIVEQGTLGDSFFIVKEGKVDVFIDGTNVRTITKHDYFGERCIFFDDRRTATVVANGCVSLWVLHKENFLKLTDENIRAYLMNRIELQDDTITMRDLAVVKTLGKGMFGNVFLCVHRQKQRLYALKTVNRLKIERFDIWENLVLERKILLQLDHTLIMKLIKTFKDRKRVYFLLEFVRGMDLFDVLRKLGLVTERDSRFYTACLIIILEHLHEREIIYRDLKPENVMVDEDGYAKLIDFGTAKVVDGRTYTIVGTPHYMAPEVIIGKGYSLAADYWSVGIMLYEFLCGGVPFGEEEEDPYKIYEKVLEHRLVYTRHIDPRSTAKPLIEELLNKNPPMRTGGSIEELKNHEWFSTVDWEELMNRLIKSPYTPKFPDIKRDVQAALMREKSMDEIITREEEQDEVPSGRSRGNLPPEGWDSEF